MSCYIVDSQTVDLVVEGARRYGVPLWVHVPSEVEAARALDMWEREIAPHCSTSLGEFLATYNALQFGARYREEMGPVPHRFDAAAVRGATCGDIWGACECLGYQLDESDDYGRSGTAAFLAQVQERAAMDAFRRLGVAVPYGAGGYDLAAF